MRDFVASPGIQFSMLAKPLWEVWEINGQVISNSRAFPSSIPTNSGTYSTPAKDIRVSALTHATHNRHLFLDGYTQAVDLPYDFKSMHLRAYYQMGEIPVI